jgi:hypothetical protein
VKWRIQFARKQIVRAAELEKHLLAIGYLGNGRDEAFLYLTPDQVTLLWLMAHGLSQGQEPAEALQKALSETARLKAEAQARIVEIFQNVVTRPTRGSEVEP